MVRKIAALAGGGAILLSVALPVLAGYGYGGYGKSDPAVEVDNDNHAYVETKAKATANSGDNSQDVEAEDDHSDVYGAKGRRAMMTGNAYADAYAEADVNNNDTKIKVPCKGCKGGVEVDNDNGARVKTKAEATANSGDNSQDVEAEDGGDVYGASGRRCLKTGSADAWSTAYSWVNTNVTRIMRGR